MRGTPRRIAWATPMVAPHAKAAACSPPQSGGAATTATPATTAGSASSPAPPGAATAARCIRAELSRGGKQAARLELERLRRLRHFTADDGLEQLIDSLPDAAARVLQYAATSPFSALGIDRSPRARQVNTENRKTTRKIFHNLARQLHPDKLDHEMATEVMQKLMEAYEGVSGGA